LPGRGQGIGVYSSRLENRQKPKEFLTIKLNPRFVDTASADPSFRAFVVVLFFKNRMILGKF
jgi:hypothetical protein